MLCLIVSHSLRTIKRNNQVGSEIDFRPRKPPRKGTRVKQPGGPRFANEMEITHRTEWQHPCPAGLSWLLKRGLIGAAAVAAGDSLGSSCNREITFTVLRRLSVPSLLPPSQEKINEIWEEMQLGEICWEANRRLGFLHLLHPQTFPAPRAQHGAWLHRHAAQGAASFCSNQSKARTYRRTLYIHIVLWGAPSPAEPRGSSPSRVLACGHVCQGSALSGSVSGSLRPAPETFRRTKGLGGGEPLLLRGPAGRESLGANFPSPSVLIEGCSAG